MHNKFNSIDYVSVKLQIYISCFISKRKKLNHVFKNLYFCVVVFYRQQIVSRSFGKLIVNNKTKCEVVESQTYYVTVWMSWTNNLG